MLRTVQPTLLIALLMTQLVAEGAAMGGLQRRREPSATLGTSPLDALGIVPESIGSILWLYLGRNISKTRVSELEADLRKSPEKIQNQVILIGYYSWAGQTSADRLSLRTHVLWVVQNHPEHPATGEPALGDLPDDPEGNAQLFDLWKENLQARGNDANVLKNAERFFFDKDPAEAERIIQVLAEKEPTNRQWPQELAELYTMLGIPGYAAKDPAQTASEAYTRVLALTKGDAARQALAGDMAEMAFKEGELSAATQMARVDLQTSDGSALQRANTIMGRVALRSGDLAGAKQYLLDSSNPDAARFVSLPGPTMSLAKELLDQGQREVVLQYLENCISLWPRGESALRTWISTIEGGRTPSFGNLAF